MNLKKASQTYQKVEEQSFVEPEDTHTIVLTMLKELIRSIELFEAIFSHDSFIFLPRFVMMFQDFVFSIISKVLRAAVGPILSVQNVLLMKED